LRVPGDFIRWVYEDESNDPTDYHGPPAGPFSRFVETKQGGYAARKPDGTVACWGDLVAEDWWSQACNALPAGVKKIVASCALLADDTLVCWAPDAETYQCDYWFEGAPGKGAVRGHPTPGQTYETWTPLDGTFKDLDCFQTFGPGPACCAVHKQDGTYDDGQLECWGKDWDYCTGDECGELPACPLLPLVERSDSMTDNYKKVAANEFVGCAIKTDDNKAQCWAYNEEDHSGSYPPPDAALKDIQSPVYGGPPIYFQRLSDSKVSCQADDDCGEGVADPESMGPVDWWHANSNGAYLSSGYGVGLRVGNIKRWQDPLGYLDPTFGATPNYVCKERPRLNVVIN
jgi:hypothetical protein